MEYSEKDLLSGVLSHWDCEFVQRVEDMDLPGSPERTEFRWLWRDTAGRGWILEGSRMEKRAQRENQARRLEFLKQAGLPVLYFVPARDRQCGYADGQVFWQLRPWIDGAALPREDYGNEDWRGRAAAGFLHDMQKAVPRDMPLFQDGRFSLREYIPMIMHVFHHRKPALCGDLKPILEALKPFLEYYDRLPERFCHGDYHPLNIIWGSQKINCVIDWEFCGRKIEIYDAANLLGCLGMDQPDFLTGPMLRGFMKQAGRDGLYAAESWDWLPECIVALRFAWMREWVYRDQLPMICQELDFMHIVADHFQFLKDRWREFRR